MLFQETDLEQILKAVRFAAFKHRNQRRKDQEGTPYINHPIDLAVTLWTVGGVREVAVLVAAILHDTIEDTGTQPEEIREQFGEEVLALVMEVTDDKSLPKAVRKQLQVEHASHKSMHAKLIKLADKIHNVYVVSHSPPADWPLERRQEYLDWTESVVAGLRGANPALEAHYNVTLAEARLLLSQTTL